MNALADSIGISLGDQEFSKLMEEISDKFQRREPVALDQYCSRFPQYAETLQQLIPSMEMLAHWGGEDSSSDADELLRGRPLGDFQLIREIGRGGMGVVYEAEQLSLCRRVALKVLPFAAMMDPRHLQRFHNEAQAAAQLHHPHIVPVHAVGSDRGIHFYAMQMIPGRSLAEIISALKQPRMDELGNGELTDPKATAGSREARQPADADTRPMAEWTARTRENPADFFRHVARLGIYAAAALQYSHSQGVIHRDIKPANLLLDESGILWITDFGLAIMNNDCSLTASQDLVGTLRYMSPEQATGGFVLDHRTDIYSLGATLYELAALQPAFPSDNRQQLIHDIENSDPITLRKLDRQIPNELVTIITKAIEKHPADRYVTAEQLRDDLQRFLDHRPLIARPPKLTQRVAKWTRRNRSLAFACALITLVVAIASVTSSLLVFGAYRRELSLRQTSDSLQIRAQENLNLASDAVEKLLVGMAEQAKAGNQLPAAQAFLDEAATLYDRLTDRSQDPNVQRQVAKGQMLIGEVKELLGLHEQSQVAYEHAIKILTAIDGTSDSVDQQLLSELATAYRGLANALFSLNFYARAEAPFRAAQETFRRMRNSSAVVDAQSIDVAIAEMNVSLGTVYWTTGRLDQAEDAYKQAIAIFDKPDHQASTASPMTDRRYGAAVGNLAILSRERGNLVQARDYLDRAYAYNSAYFNAAPNDPHARNGFYHAVWNDADLLIREGKVEQANRQSQRLVEMFPNRLSSYVEAAKFQLRCAELIEPPQRSMHIDSARRMIESANQASHREPVFVNMFANLLLDATVHELRDPERAFDMIQHLVQEHPTRWEFWQTLGKAHYRLGEYEQALENLNRSVTIHHGADWSNLFWLAMTHAQLGNRVESLKCWNDVKDESPDTADSVSRNEFVQFRAEASQVMDGLKVIP